MTAEDLCRLFNRLFEVSHNTVLLGDATEPLYEVAVRKGDHHKIYFRENFASSALHEMAHWCIAGNERRQLDDYGYWYSQQRDGEQQRQFELLEARPQALEWLLSVAADVQFRVSCDNFDTEVLNVDDFRRCVHWQLKKLLAKELPARASLLAGEFASHSTITDYTDHKHYLGLPK